MLFVGCSNVYEEDNLIRFNHQTHSTQVLFCRGVCQAPWGQRAATLTVKCKNEKVAQ